ncbi:MAG: PEP-CTERM sorting domain-containing protein [Steroidobacteraceae bacterium]
MSATITNAGTIEVYANGVIANGIGTTYVSTVNNDAGSVLFNFGEVDNYSTLNNSGTITPTSTFNNNGTLTNFLGTINNTGNFNNYGGTINNAGTLTNYVGATFTNVDFGTLYNNSGGTLTNLGTFVPAFIINNGTLQNSGGISDNGVVASGGSFANRGPIDLEGPGILDIQVGGTLDNFAGSTFDWLPGGQMIVDGAVDSARTMQMNGGILSGTGTINTSIINSDGDVQPGDDAPGTLTIHGSYTQTGGIDPGTLTIDRGGTGAGDFSVLDVSGLAELSGVVDFSAVSGFTPGAGDDFTFLLFGGLSGACSDMDFTNWTCPADDSCTDVVGPDSLTLEIAAASSATAVPEPGTLVLAATGLFGLGVVLRRGRKRSALWSETMSPWSR